MLYMLVLSPSNVWFQCKTSECLVSFKFLSRFEWVVFSDHFITKSCYYQAKIFAGLVICVLATSLFSFERAVNLILIFHILILHCTVVLVC